MKALNIHTQTQEEKKYMYMYNSLSKYFYTSNIQWQLIN